MTLYKLILVIAVCLTSLNHVYADSYVVHGIVYAQNQHGQLIPQNWKNQSNTKKLPEFSVSIVGYKKPEEIKGDGKFTFTFPKEDPLYAPGKAVTFTVNKADSKIISPLNGKTFLPKSAEGKVELVLGFKGARKKKDLFAVQLLKTNNQTRAIALKNDLAKDLIISKSEEWKKVPVYIEEYMVGNMPDNGYDYKVKAGNFTEKDFAVLFQQYLVNRYKKMHDSFITRKGHK